MISTSDALNTISFKKHFIIAPNSKFISWNKSKYLRQNKNGRSCKSGFSYNSEANEDFLTVNELRKLIQSNIKK